jgi:hypothetical protein
MRFIQLCSDCYFDSRKLSESALPEVSHSTMLGGAAPDVAVWAMRVVTTKHNLSAPWLLRLSQTNVDPSQPAPIAFRERGISPFPDYWLGISLECQEPSGSRVRRTFNVQTERDAQRILPRVLAEDDVSCVCLEGAMGWHLLATARRQRYEHPGGARVKELTFVIADEDGWRIGDFLKPRRARAVFPILKAVILRARPYESIFLSTVDISELLVERVRVPDGCRIQLRTAGVHLFGNLEHLPTHVDYDDPLLPWRPTADPRQVNIHDDVDSEALSYLFCGEITP